MQDIQAAANLLCEQTILTDVLATEKQATSVYNTFAGECVSEKLRTSMLDILKDTHEIQAKVFKEMQTRGWYQTENAPTAKVKEAKTKAQSNAT